MLDLNKMFSSKSLKQEEDRRRNLYLKFLEELKYAINQGHITDCAVDYGGYRGRSGTWDSSRTITFKYFSVKDFPFYYPTSKFNKFKKYWLLFLYGINGVNPRVHEDLQ